MGFDAVSNLGIKDVYNVGFGGPTEVIFEEGEVSVFWVSFRVFVGLRLRNGKKCMLMKYRDVASHLKLQS